MNYTSIEQSKKLLELGLKPETADMYYFLDPTPVGNIYSPVVIFIEKHLKSRMPEYNKGDIPCWSVGALIKVLPHDIVYQTKLFEPTHCGLNLSKTGVGYASSIDRYPDRSFNQCWTENPDLIDALYNCIVWLLENKYIKKE